jgi:hypothetical protein
MWIDSRNDSKQPGRAASATRNPWHAVGIVPGHGACMAAQTCKGKRFLSKEAPRLPLTECVMRCECRYRHFEDRRGQPRRAEERGAPPNRVSLNRRHIRGRRITD